MSNPIQVVFESLGIDPKFRSLEECPLHPALVESLRPEDCEVRCVAAFRAPLEGVVFGDFDVFEDVENVAVMAYAHRGLAVFVGSVSSETAQRARRVFRVESPTNFFGDRTFRTVGAAKNAINHAPERAGPYDIVEYMLQPTISEKIRWPQPEENE